MATPGQTARVATAPVATGPWKFKIDSIIPEAECKLVELTYDEFPPTWKVVGDVVIVIAKNHKESQKEAVKDGKPVPVGETLVKRLLNARVKFNSGLSHWGESCTVDYAVVSNPFHSTNTRDVS